MTENSGQSGTQDGAVSADQPHEATSAWRPEEQARFPAPPRPPAQAIGRPVLDDRARREALERSGAGGTAHGPPTVPAAATAASTGSEAASGRPARPTGPAVSASTGAAPPAGEAATTVMPSTPRRDRPGQPRSGSTRPVARGRRARLVLQRIDPWSVFLFALVASICLGIILLVAVTTLYVVLANLGVLGSVNNVLGEVLGGNGPDDVAEPFFTAGRVLGATAVLAAVDVVLLTVLATLGALLYNLCASLTGGIEVVLGERD